ncbi:MAG TPA: hypothetical protein VET88_04630, partial [Gammaproteobacteria bacterium]|nr:hypothetical protein [Gammaproteobacteria bacterium]
MQIPYRHTEKIKINQHTKTPTTARLEAFPVALCILPEKPGAADWAQLPAADILKSRFQQLRRRDRHA